MWPLIASLVGQYMNKKGQQSANQAAAAQPKGLEPFGSWNSNNMEMGMSNQVMPASGDRFSSDDLYGGGGQGGGGSGALEAMLRKLMGG